MCLMKDLHGILIACLDNKKYSCVFPLISMFGEEDLDCELLVYVPGSHFTWLLGVRIVRNRDNFG